MKDTTPPRQVVRADLSCLICGEIAGVVEDQCIVRPRSQGSIRFDGRRLLCGRCGSILLVEERDRTWLPPPPTR